VLQKRLENVRGVGSVTWSAACKREINLYLRPAAMEAMGISVEQVLAAVRSENQELPPARPLARDRKRGADQRALRAGGLRARSSWRASNGAPVKLGQVADIVDGPQEIESLALYNGQRTLLLSVQKSQGENTIAVVDGLNARLRSCSRSCPGHGDRVNRDNSRPSASRWPTCSARCSRARLLTIGSSSCS
jgi:hydrophobic/amphiphilic exporter-1 (mainly G- bacteria), HAE1 family